MPRSSSQATSSSPTPSEEDHTRPGILALGRGAPHSPPVYMHGISTPITSPNELDSPTRKKFKYLSPRIGSYFQADVEPFKVGGATKEDDITISSQASSSLLGQSSTGGTGTGRKKKAGRPKGGGRSSSLKKQESIAPEIYEPTATLEQSKRGGICVHRPTSTHLQHDRFLTFGRNIMLQTPRDVHYNIARADCLWKKAQQDDIYRAMEQPVVKKPGRKRKMDREDSVVSETFKKCTSKGKGSSDGIHDTAAIGLEDDDCMLEYLQFRGRGKAGRAEFIALATLCRGKAMTMRRRIKKMRKEEEKSMPLSAVIAPLSDSWRRRYERGVFSKVIGDYRRNPRVCNYPYFEAKSNDVLESNATSNVYPWIKGTANDVSDENSKNASSLHAKFDSWNDLDVVERNKQLMDEWKLILESGQNVLEKLKNGIKPHLPDLLTILTKAYTIPQPEEVYGRRDSTTKNISICLNSIMDLIEQGRNALAYFMDGLYDIKDEGIDVQSLSKNVDKKSSECQVQLGEAEIMRDIISEALEWESRLNKNENTSEDDDSSSNSSEDLHLPQQSLSSAEDLASQGNCLSIRPKTLVALEDRIQRAYVLRTKIREWNQSNNDNESVKYLASMIKDANKINLGFPELSLLSKVHKNAEEWIDRANVALRSKISLAELQDLVHLGDKLPLGVTTTLDKLRSRLNSAIEWIADLKEVVPCPLESLSECGTELDARLKAEWFMKMWEVLRKEKDDDATSLKELSTTGARLPVEVEFVHLLQTAIDGRNWSLKAKRWVPSSGDQFRRGKIDDLMDHLEFSKTIIAKFNKLTDDLVDWKLDYSDELQGIVDKAEIWYEKYEPFLSSDARKSQRPVISCQTIVDIIQEAEQIPTNLGNPMLKINRIHNEVKSWIECNRDLLHRSHIPCIFGEEPEGGWTKKIVTIQEVNAAIESASKELSVDLEEVQQLINMADQSKEWFEEVQQIAPIHSKRSVGYGRDKQKSKRSMKDVLKLLDAGANVPMDTTKDVERIKILLNDTRTWAATVNPKLVKITIALQNLSRERDDIYGPPDKILESNDGDVKEDNESNSVEIAVSAESDQFSTIKKTSDSNDVYRMMNDLAQSADDSPILTFEEELVLHFVNVLKWCQASSEIIDTYEDLFGDDKWKKELTKLLTQSSDLDLFHQKFQFSFPDEDSSEFDILVDMNKSAVEFVGKETIRLEKLKEEQNKYDSWCYKVREMYEESEKRIPIEALRVLSEEASDFPESSDVARKITREYNTAKEWIENAKVMLQSSSKLRFDDVKVALNKIHRVKFTSEEYHKLRNALSDARSWANKCKKSGLETGSAPITVLKALMDDYDRLSIAMPEEFDALKQAICGYCICRRPYEGFMIGCDTCDEWYHGSCIGITEAQGEKIEKFVCVRCSLKKVFHMCCAKTASVIRKWCDPKELSKARSQDNQKHQRKVREKKKEIEKWKDELQKSLKELQALKAMQINQQSSLPLSNNLHNSTNNHHTPDPTFQALSSTPVEQNASVPVTAESELPLSFSGELLENKLNAIKFDIAKATKALEQCNFRMEKLKDVSNARKAMQNKEDRMAPWFRHLCVMIKQNILAPDTDEIAKKSQPKPSSLCISLDDLLSPPMKEILLKIHELGVDDFPDSVIIKDSLYGIGWCCLALNVLKKKPTLEEVRTVIALSDHINIPEAKCVTMLKSMVARTTAWMTKVNKVLVPTPGDTTPFDSNLLKDLSLGMIAVPMSTPEEILLCNVIEDEGKKHCKCCSPRDSSMMTCQSCGKWYHNHCLPTPISDPKSWICDTCQYSTTPVTKQVSREKFEWPFRGVPGDVSAHAPTPEKIWPPYGLSGSAEARAALGVASTFKLETMEVPAFIPSVAPNTTLHSHASTSQPQDSSSENTGTHQLQVATSHSQPPQAIEDSSHLTANYGTPPAMKSNGTASHFFNSTNISGIDEDVVKNAVQMALEVAISGLSDGPSTSFPPNVSESVVNIDAPIESTKVESSLKGTEENQKMDDPSSLEEVDSMEKKTDTKSE